MQQNRNIITLKKFLYLLSGAVLSSTTVFSQSQTTNTIQPSATHPQYWSYKGENILLLGGSNNDGLFQAPDFIEQLDLLQSVGGNYVRNTMGAGRESVWPFKQMENGKYDLDQWNDKYWNRFENLLKETSKRDIIVQIEVWATFNFYRKRWGENPFNPQNNINYDVERVKLATEVPTHPIYCDNDFFRSVPTQLANAKLLEYQQKFVDKMLFYSLQYDNVLYCMDNETSVNVDWGSFWANYIRKKAKEQGKTVHTTEMWDPWDLSHAFHNETFDHPETYTFVDISQNNHITGQEHWDNGLKQIERLKQINALRPVTNIKVYGNDGGKHQTTRNGIESFCQNVFFGCSSTRFHRPTAGQGLNEIAQATIKSMRELSDKMDFFNGKPMNELLSEREENEAYCRAIPGKEYAIYFTNGGEVQLDLSALEGKATVQWVEILKAEWSKKSNLKGGKMVRLTCPEKEGHWVVLITKEVI